MRSRFRWPRLNQPKNRLRFRLILALKLALKEMELQAQAPVNADAISRPPPYRDAKSLKLQAFVDKKDELGSYLLCFERYAENDKWEKITWALRKCITVQCITIRKSHGCKHQVKMLTTTTEEGTLNQLQFY